MLVGIFRTVGFIFFIVSKSSGGYNSLTSIIIVRNFLFIIQVCEGVLTISTDEKIVYLLSSTTVIKGDKFTRVSSFTGTVG